MCQPHKNFPWDTEEKIDSDVQAVFSGFVRSYKYGPTFLLDMDSPLGKRFLQAHPPLPSAKWKGPNG